jgi:all-trans-retinol 13,14-reductase
MADEGKTERVPDFGEHYDVVVVGAGIGGLCCGALLAKEGLKVLVAERQDYPGGYVTSYERRGYSFQVPHLMSGCGFNGPVTRIADHLGLAVDFIKVDPYQRYIFPEHEITVPAEPNAFMDGLKEDFLPQTDNINRFFTMADRVSRGMKVKMLRRPIPIGMMLAMPFYPLFNSKAFRFMNSRVTYQDLLDKYFTDEKLKAVLSAPWYWLGSPPWEMSAASMIGTMTAFWDGAYMPAGGYRALADAFVDVLVDNGGDLLLGHEVVSINTDQGKVSEVEMQPRARVSTDAAVSDGDTRRTFMRLLNRENFSAAFLDRIEGQDLSMSGVVIHLGMAKKVDDERLQGGVAIVQPSYDMRENYDELTVSDRYPDPEKLSYSIMAHSFYDPSLAPEGKCSIDVVVPGAPYNFMERWGVEEGGKRGRAYQSIKEKYSEVVVEAVSRTFPDLIHKVEAFDVSTPITFERYTMAIDGCWYDSAAVPGQVFSKRTGPKTSVKGLYVTGAKSVLAGGIEPSIVGGLLAADSMLRGKLGRLF